MNEQRELLAIYVGAPQLRAAYQSALVATRRFDNVVTLASGWLLATRALGPQLRANGPRPLSPTRGATSLQFALGEANVAQQSGGLERFSELLEREPRRMAEFQGDFAAFALLPQGRARVLRAVNGIPAVYVSQNNGATLLSTRLEWLALFQPNQPQIDWLPLSLYAAGWPAFPDQRCPVRGAFHVKRGQYVIVNPGQPLTSGSYWTAPDLQTPARDALPRLAHAVRDALDSEVNAALSPRDENVLLFSGGLDSAAIAASARNRGIPLQALSILPPNGSPEQAREAGFQSALGGWFTRHETCVLDQPAVLDTEKQAPLGYYPMPHFFSLVARYFSARVIAAGWFADELFGVVRFPDRFEQCSYAGLPRLMLTTPIGPRALLRWHRYRSGEQVQPVPTHVSRTFAALVGEEHRDWYRDNVLRQRPIARGAAAQPEQAHAVRAHALADRTAILAECAASLGATLCVPYFARSLVELAFAAHPQLLFDRHFAKVPLRQALRGRLPRHIVERPDSGNYTLGANRVELPPSECARLIDILDPFLDKAQLSSHARLTWDDQFELCIASRVAEHHKALCYERQSLHRDHRLS